MARPVDSKGTRLHCRRAVFVGLIVFGVAGCNPRQAPIVSPASQPRELEPAAAARAPGAARTQPSQDAPARWIDPADLPAIPREFRAAWVATVDNIDWPSKPGLPTADQQAELVAILDRCASLRINAVVFQVRPVGDALFASETEPWSAYLSGRQGQAPEPFYDPLAFAIDESHARGIELHAWFNPFRTSHPSNKTVAAGHITQRRPDWNRAYGPYTWLDPGEPDVHAYVLDVIRDVVRRYDVDGVHLDDYFYPYPVTDKNKKPVDFPDDASWRRYVSGGGQLDRADWRRDNINRFVRALYAAVHEEKPHAKVGLSPFGIWRPGNPPQIKGFDAYEQIYVDSRLWIKEGWLDYLTPQLYWAIDATAQSYPALLDWWIEQDTLGRHIWPGLFTSRIKDGRSDWPAEEICQQIRLTRQRPRGDGHVHFSMKAIMANRDGIADRLGELYATPALVPPCDWLAQTRPAAPRARVAATEEGAVLVQMAPAVDPSTAHEPTTTAHEPPANADNQPATAWVIYTRYGDEWRWRLLPGVRSQARVPTQHESAPLREIAVSLIDACGQQSPAALAR